MFVKQGWPGAEKRRKWPLKEKQLQKEKLLKKQQEK